MTMFKMPKTFALIDPISSFRSKSIIVHHPLSISNIFSYRIWIYWRVSKMPMGQFNTEGGWEMKLRLIIVGTETRTIRMPIFIPSGVLNMSVTFSDDWILEDVFTHPYQIKRLNLNDDETRLYYKLIASHIDYLKRFVRKNRLRFLTRSAFDTDDFIMKDSYNITDAELIYSE
jgi:hypothetical protein